MLGAKVKMSDCHSVLFIFYNCQQPFLIMLKSESMTFSKLKQPHVHSVSHTYEILRKNPGNRKHDIQLECSVNSSRCTSTHDESCSGWKQEINAAIHSSIFRTMTPPISSTHRNQSFTPLIFGGTGGISPHSLSKIGGLSFNANPLHDSP